MARTSILFLALTTLIFGCGESPAPEAPSPQAEAAQAPAAEAEPAPVIEEPPVVDVNAPMGKVILNAKPYAKYYIDGKEVKMARGQPLEVTVGKHAISFQDTTSSRRHEMTVVVDESRVNRFCWDFDEERDFCK